MHVLDPVLSGPQLSTRVSLNWELQLGSALLIKIMYISVLQSFLSCEELLRNSHTPASKIMYKVSFLNIQKIAVRVHITVI